MSIGFLAMAGAALADDSCRWANDGECDDPTVPWAITAACPPGTDSTDCRQPAQAGPNSCRWANDGECDDPTVPGHITSACLPGTDANDCGQASGGQSPAPTSAGTATTYAMWTRITNDQRHYATQPGGVMEVRPANGMAFQAGNYTIYSAVSQGIAPGTPLSDIRAFGWSLSPNTMYVARASGAGHLSFVPGGGEVTMYQRPPQGMARVFARNDDVVHIRAICILPAGWPLSQCGM
ncbi:MAG: hypothetical protein R3D60_07975 [Paracoccaceae bacterium]